MLFGPRLRSDILCLLPRASSLVIADGRELVKYVSPYYPCLTSFS